MTLQHKNLADDHDLLHDKSSVEGTKFQCIPNTHLNCPGGELGPIATLLGLLLGIEQTDFLACSPHICTTYVISTHRPASYLVLGLPRGNCPVQQYFRLRELEWALTRMPTIT